jgi:homoserine dehydrogenase
MAVYDRPGAMAAIASRMGEQEISIESIVQRRPRSALPGIGARLAPGELAPLVMITHETTEVAVRRALAAIEADGKVAGKPQMIRIEKL